MEASPRLLGSLNPKILAPVDMVLATSRLCVEDEEVKVVNFLLMGLFMTRVVCV